VISDSDREGEHSRVVDQIRIVARDQVRSGRECLSLLTSNSLTLYHYSLALLSLPNPNPNLSSVPAPAPCPVPVPVPQSQPLPPCIALRLG
jgi:hypothetical protein